MTHCHQTSRTQESDELVATDIVNQEDNEDQAILIRQLRQALLKEIDLKSRLDDKFLLKFLRARKFNIDRALSLVKNYYKQRIKYPDFYKNLRSSAYPKVFATNGLGKFRDKDPEGHTVFFANKIGVWDPAENPVVDLLSCTLLALELAIEDEEAQENGFVFLMDAEGFGFTHLRAFDPYTIAQIISVTWNSFPAKFKRVHIINAPSYFELLYSMIKPFLTRKLKRRFKFHGHDLSNLHKYIPKEILPEEFGGDLGPLDTSEWNEKLLQNDHVIERDTIYGYIVD